MGRASSSKKVSRAASTGGGRTARGSRPLVWYGAMALVVLLGVAGIWQSRQDRRAEFASGKDLTAPAVGRDHWHAAYGLFLCDEFSPPITVERDPKGIHTHGDGVVHIHPTVRSAAGRNATLSVFADAVGLTLTDDEIKLPGGKSFKEGKTKCGGKPGIVQVQIDGDKVVTEDVAKIKFTDRQLLTIAFAPKGAPLSKPPSEAKLDDLDDVAPPTSPSASVTVPSEGTDGAATTAPAADASTTTAP